MLVPDGMRVPYACGARYHVWKNENPDREYDRIACEVCGELIAECGAGRDWIAQLIKKSPGSESW